NYIYRRHHRNSTASNLSDTFNAADYYGSHQCGQYQAKIKTISFHKPKLAGQDLKGLVGLEHIATSQGGSYTQHCKKNCQYFSQSPKVSFFQPIPQIIHRSPKYLPL